MRGESAQAADALMDGWRQRYEEAADASREAGAPERSEGMRPGRVGAGSRRADGWMAPRYKEAAPVSVIPQ